MAIAAYDLRNALQSSNLLTTSIEASGNYKYFAPSAFDNLYRKDLLMQQKVEQALSKGKNRRLISVAHYNVPPKLSEEPENFVSFKIEQEDPVETPSNNSEAIENIVNNTEVFEKPDEESSEAPDPAMVETQQLMDMEISNRNATSIVDTSNKQTAAKRRNDSIYSDAGPEFQELGDMMQEIKLLTCHHLNKDVARIKLRFRIRRSFFRCHRFLQVLGEKSLYSNRFLHLWTNHLDVEAIPTAYLHKSCSAFASRYGLVSAATFTFSRFAPSAKFQDEIIKDVKPIPLQGCSSLVTLLRTSKPLRDEFRENGFLNVYVAVPNGEIFDYLYCSTRPQQEEE